MTHLLIASGPSEYVHQVCNRLMSRNQLYFSTAAQIPIIEDCMGFDGVEGNHRWREFSGGAYGASQLLLDILNESVTISSVALLPHFSYSVTYDALTAEDFLDHYLNNALSMLYSLLFLQEHDRLKPGAKISILQGNVPTKMDYVSYHSSFSALRSALQSLKQSTDLFSTCDYMVHIPPVNPKPEVEDDYVEQIAQLLER